MIGRTLSRFPIAGRRAASRCASSHDGQVLLVGPLLVRNGDRVLRRLFGHRDQPLVVQVHELLSDRLGPASSARPAGLLDRRQQIPESGALPDNVVHSNVGRRSQIPIA